MLAIKGRTIHETTRNITKQFVLALPQGSLVVAPEEQHVYSLGH